MNLLAKIDAMPQPSEANIVAAAHILSEWLDDDAPLHEWRYRDPAAAVLKYAAWIALQPPVSALRAALTAALATVPSDRKPDAWIGYWPGAGSIDSITRTTRWERTAEEWRSAGAEITPLYAHALQPQPSAPAGGEVAELRAQGWSVAVHNDYRQGGAPMTFWLFTHPSGQWIKGEGTTDAEAIAAAIRALAEEPGK